jgi:hypothetical protein
VFYVLLICCHEIWILRDNRLIGVPIQSIESGTVAQLSRMQSARPSQPRVAATWLTVDLPTGLSIYFELAQDGSFKRVDPRGSPVPHHCQLNVPDCNANCSEPMSFAASTS